MNTDVLVAFLLLAPLVGFIINGLRFDREGPLFAGFVAVGAMLVSFYCSVQLYVNLLSMKPAERVLTANFFDWINVGNLNISASFVVDPISAVMLLVITGVGALIHLFSLGYMYDDPRPAKYFAYLNFFVFNMLILVLGDSLPVLFVGWEGVGLASYLLIGFWFKDEEKAAAGMKAFITNRIGDAAFLLGMFVLFIHFGTLNFSELISYMPKVAEAGWTGPITVACLLLFIGATGKSAQIPLYVWLPDAMAGPTPVSALIHAATMVTAGVYMIIRMNPIFILAPNAMMVIACVGAATALLAAIIGITQNDIKKVLAYSTVSQLGYMFLGVGVGAFMPALFHLMTHAFFKALMFLGSGSVIHGMHGEQDIRKMGGLKKYMPMTHFTFIIGWLAIIGMPPFAGFFSKDEILWFAYASPYGSKLLWFMGFAAAICTAFYMTRLVVLTFWGPSRVPEGVHPHESPAIMLWPLIILAFLSLVGGWIGIPHVISAILPGHPSNHLHHWLQGFVTEFDLLYHSTALEWSLMLASVSVAGIGASIAYYMYYVDKDRPEKVSAKIRPLYNLSFNKFYVDEFYFGKIINPLIQLSKDLWISVDVYFVDKVTYWASDLVKSAGGGIRSLQNGNMQQYALFISLGTIITLLIIFAG